MKFLEDILYTVKNRVKNIFYSTFAISLILYNWEFFFILIFSDQPSEQRLEHLHCNYLSVDTKWIDFLIIPLVLTLIHIFGLSRFSQWVFLHWLKYRTEANNKKIEIEGTKVLTAEEGQKLWDENRTLESENVELRKKYNELLTSTYRGKKENSSISKPSLKKSFEEDILKKLQNGSKTFNSPTDKPLIEDVLEKIKKEIIERDSKYPQSDLNINSYFDANFYETIPRIHYEGDSHYHCQISTNNHVENILKNIFHPKGFSLQFEQKNRMRFLTDIKWDRKRFQDKK